MQKLTVSIMLIAVLAVPVSAGFATAQAAEAQARSQRVPAMREPIYRQLSAAREAADRADHAAALRLLNRLKESGNLNSYEAAMVWNLLAYVHYAQDRPRQALAAYERVLEQGAIPESLRQNTLYSLAQMYLVAEEPRRALQALDRWFAEVREPGPNAWVLKGQIHYQLEEYDKARPALERALALAEARKEKPRETWLLLLRAIYYAQKDYPRLLETLEKLVALYPKREYWVQLGAVYGELGREKEQLAVLETAYEQGLLSEESDLVMLAQLLIGNGVPYKAGLVLDKALEAGRVEASARNLRLLADAWLLAKEYERGVAALQRAAGLAPDGELYLRLAQTWLEMGRHADAAEAAREALRKGDLRQPADAHVVAGIAHYNLEQYDSALQAFRKAREFEDTQKLAQQWLDYIAQERERRTRLSQSALAANEVPNAS